MNLIEALRRECVLAGAAPADKQAALAAIARLAKQSDRLDTVEEGRIRQALAEREALSTTGFGYGIAIPHCRLEEVSDFVVGLLSVPEGVEFDAMDGAPVKIVVFIQFCGIILKFSNFSCSSC